MHESDTKLINSVDDLAAGKIQSHIKKAEIEHSTHEDFNIRVRKIINLDELNNVLAGYKLKFKDLDFSDPKENKKAKTIGMTLDKNTHQSLAIINIGEHFYSIPVALQQKYKKKNSLWQKIAGFFGRTKQEQIPTKTIWDK